MTTPDNTEANSLREMGAQTGRPAWISGLMFVIILLLAAIPPALVVADRWFNVPFGDWDRDAWCRADFLCPTELPSYFVAIVGCFLVLAVTMFFHRRAAVVVAENPLTLFESLQVSPGQMRLGYLLLVASGLGMIEVIVWSLISRHWPGWDLVVVWGTCLAGWALRAVPVKMLVDFWKRDAEYWISLLLFHVAIVIALAAYYDVTQIFFLALLLLVFASGNLWRFRQRVPLIFWIISLALVFYTVNINAWWTAWIGDDYVFHNIAWAFAEKMSFAQVGEMLFQADGVNFTHPYFSSFVQGISMKLLGHDSFGWRFSSLYLCALGVGLFYLFCKSFLPRRAALVATCLLACSHYVMSFGKIGYNNLQALFALALVLALAAWALRWKQPIVFALLGSALALCFYLYPAALYVIPAPILLLLIYDPPTSRQAAGRWLVMVTMWAALIYPLMIQPLYWSAKQAGTLFNNPEVVQSPASIVQHFAQNIFYAIFSFVYVPEGHYIAVSNVDPLSAVFVMLGYFVLLYQMRRQRFAVFVALIFVIFLFSVGASHDRQVPPDTRMFLMLPWFALFGMWGILWLEENIKKAGVFRAGSKMTLVPILLIAIAGANLYQAYSVSYTRYSGLQYFENLFVGLTQNIQKAEPNRPKNIAVLTNDGWGISDLLEFQNVYPHLAWFHLYQIRISEPLLPEDDRTLFSDRDTIIMLSPYLDQEWQNTLDAPLLALGKAHCDVLTPDGQKRFVLYYAPDMPQACSTNLPK